jgi:signal transduction histidine kinase
MIEDLDEDLRLVHWRESLLQAGVRSLLICQTSKTDNLANSGQTQISASSATTLAPLLVIAHGTPRTWNQTERELVSIVAQQINLLLLVGQLQDSVRYSFLTHQTFQAGLSALQQAPLDPLLFERSWVQYLGTLLKCPLAALLSWTPESGCATVAAAVVADPRFALPPDLAIPVATNTLIQDALATRSFLCRPVSALEANTRKLLNCPSIGQLLVIALHTDGTPPTGILLLADREERQWSHHLLPPLETLTQQFSWFRYYRHHLSQQTREGENLQTLNWYKHRCLEALHQSVQESVSALLELEAKTSPPGSKGGSDRSNPTDLGEINPYLPLKSDRPLQRMRRQQLLHQLEVTLAVLTPVLKEEQWQSIARLEAVPLANLLKRSIRRVEPLYERRQLILQLHNPGNNSVYGDYLKLECILFELLVTACFHAQPRSRINLWCRPLSPESKPTPSTNSSHPLLELLLAESGLLDECLHALTSSPLQSPPSLNLKICQTILHSWGGDLQFYPLEEGRYASRLLLPLANRSEASR